MNKLKLTIAGMLIACLGMGVMNAQDKSATTPAAKTSKKAAPTKTAPATKAAPATGGQHLKKDGTPDMRYKENKAAAGKPAAPASKKETAKPAPKKTAPKKAAGDKKGM